MREKWYFIVLKAIISVTIFFGGCLLSEIIYHSKDPECIAPPGVAIDGGADARVYTWHDLNGNGIIDSGEPPFPKVEIDYPYLMGDSQFTDKNGRIDTSVFKAGCVCRCWEGEFVKIVVPEGYQTTTPIQQELIGHNRFYIFGFIANNP